MPSQTVRLIRKALKDADRPIKHGHSIRIGATIKYLLRGVPFEAMKSIGQWPSGSFSSSRASKCPLSDESPMPGFSLTNKWEPACAPRQRVTITKGTAAGRLPSRFPAGPESAKRFPHFVIRFSTESTNWCHLRGTLYST